MDVSSDTSQETGDWQTAGIFRVSDGVYRVPLPLPLDALRAVNVYLIVHGDDVVVVDSGWANADSRALLLQALSALELTPHAISRFLITHMHRDHLEQAVAVRRDFGTKVALGRDEIGSIEISNDATTLPFAVQVPWLRELGAVKLAQEIDALSRSYERPSPLGYPDEWLDAGDITLAGGRVLTGIPTPGHTRGHFVFHDEAASMLFAGDHVLPTITPSIGFEAPLSDDPLGAFLGSLQHVRARADARLLPAHGPVAASVHARVDELLDHHGTRLDQCVKALRDGSSTGAEVAQRLRWTRRGRVLGELDVFNRMLAVGETGYHLSLLVSQGRVTCETEDGVRRYTPS